MTLIAKLGHLRLSAAELACLSEIGSGSLHVKRGIELAREGETAHKAFILQTGWACCYKELQGGSRQIISFPLPGDFLGLASILLRSSDHSFAALTDVVVNVLNITGLMRIFEKFPRVAAAILWTASRDQAMVIDHLVGIGRRNAMERVAHCFLELHQRLKLIGMASETEFDCPLTQNELADALGLSPIHVNRVLRQLRQQDLLTLKSQRAIVHNLGGLVKLAGYDGGYLDQVAAYSQNASGSERQRRIESELR